MLNPEEIAQLVDDAKRLGMNSLGKKHKVDKPENLSSYLYRSPGDLMHDYPKMPIQVAEAVHTLEMAFYFLIMEVPKPPDFEALRDEIMNIKAAAYSAYTDGESINIARLKSAEHIYPMFNDFSPSPI